MTSFLQDLRYAARIFAKNPGFAVMAILTLAFGIGANTAIFSVVNALLLRPLNFNKPDDLYVLTLADPRKNVNGIYFGHILFRSMQEQNSTLAGISAFANDSFDLIGGSAPEQLQAGRVSASFF